MMIDGKTTICAVIGDPVEHSLSPCMHNAAFEALDLNYAYVAFHVKEVGKAIEGMLGFNIRGLSVTIPHKIEIMQYLDEITPLARNIGAVNTVTNENGKLYGANTDGFGSLRALEAEEKADGKVIAILGVGGAARAVAFTLACERKPKKIYLLHRPTSAPKAQKISTDLHPHTSVMIATAPTEKNEMREILAESDIIINTTPIGMHPNVDDCLVEESWLSQKHLVFDMIYNPAKTLLLQRAEARFARIINGVPMFVNQGAEQFHIWTGKTPPTHVMQQAVMKALGHS